MRRNLDEGAAAVHPLIIGITGPSGAGKSTLARNIVTTRKAKDDVAILPLDMYYKDVAHLELSERRKINYDHPDSLDYKRLMNDIQALRNGKVISYKILDYGTCLYQDDKVVKVEPKPVILVEGLLLLNNPELTGLFDLSIFINTPLDVCRNRILKRGVEERGQSVEFNTKRYEETVKPMYAKFVEQYKCDVNHKLDGQSDITQEALRIIERLLSKRCVESKANGVSI